MPVDFSLKCRLFVDTRETGCYHPFGVVDSVSGARRVNKKPPQEGDSDSKASVGTRLEQVCDAFESHWRRALGGDTGRPEIERFLDGISAQERWAFLRELILTDQQYRELVGEAVGAGEYEQRFPEFSEFIPALFRSMPSLERIRDYRLLEVIGRGGMGVVYRARHMRLGKARAVKVLARHLLDNQEALERFRLEVENSGRLDHPNIVQALDAGEENDVHFLVMEFVEGWDLTRLVESGERLTVEAACELIRQASVGLQHAHDNFLVHRDIKPSNLMLSQNGSVKILDLGLARFIAEQSPETRLTATSAPMGTCDYMAPEQWSDASSVDIRADIYSLGCTLFYLLTARPPFSGEDHKSLVQKQLAHQRARVPSVLETRTDAPDELQYVIERMMAKEPDDRYAEPAEVVEDIEDFAQPSSVQSLVSSLAEPGARRDVPTDPLISPSLNDTKKSSRRRRKRRRPWDKPWYRQPAWLAAVVLLAALILTLVSVLRPQRASENLVRDIETLPGLNGQWWFDEMPWYTPFARTAVAEALRTEDAVAVLGDDAEGYLDSNVAQVQTWLGKAVDRCRDSLSAQQLQLLDELTAVSSERLEDEELKERLRQSYDTFAQDRQEWTDDDLYTRAVLEHKLAALSNDGDMADRAIASYDAALAEYGRAKKSGSTLGLLCQADSARLCSLVLSNYDEAFQRFRAALTPDAPLLFEVETRAAFGHASRKAGDYRDDEFQRAKTRLQDSNKIEEGHPLLAHVCERYAWSLMDRWNVRKAEREFKTAYSIRHLNWNEGKGNPFASIYRFHNLHGLAMAQRYLGNVASAEVKYTELIAEIKLELEKGESQESPPPGHQRYLRDLRERLTNSKERLADCVLYHEAALGPEADRLEIASVRYREATDEAEDLGAKIVHTLKQSIVLALMGDVKTARERLEEARQQSVIGEGSKRVDVVLSLAERILDYKEAEDPTAGHGALGQFLLQQCHLSPYEQLRRETLELQLLCAELLLRSELASEAGQAVPSEDLEYLETLLGRFTGHLKEHSAVDEMLPFLRRFYDLAISVIGQTQPVDSASAAQLILTARGPGYDGSASAVRVFFHLHENDGLAVVLLPDGTNAAFRLDSVGRRQIKQNGRSTSGAQDLSLPEALVELVQQHQNAGGEIECLWSDGQCWPATEEHQALTTEEFPFTGLLGPVTVR